jgi:hypothetical protein
MNNELFIVKPSLKQYYGRTVTKEMEFDEWTEDKTVHQILKDLVLTTEVKKESEFNGMKMTEDSKLTQTLPEGIVLIWREEEGYIIPNYPMYKVKDLENEIEEVKDIYKDNTDMNPKEE